MYIIYATAHRACIRARKIHTRTRTDGHAHNHLASERAAKRVHRFFLPPLPPSAALPGFSARYEATDKLSVLPCTSRFNVERARPCKDEEGRREERHEHEISDALVNAGVLSLPFLSSSLSLSPPPSFSPLLGSPLAPSRT